MFARMSQQAQGVREKSMRMQMWLDPLIEKYSRHSGVESFSYQPQVTPTRPPLDPLTVDPANSSLTHIRSVTRTASEMLVASVKFGGRRSWLDALSSVGSCAIRAFRNAGGPSRSPALRRPLAAVRKHRTRQ